jgi:hypothetical protein
MVNGLGPLNNEVQAKQQTGLLGRRPLLPQDLRVKGGDQVSFRTPVPPNEALNLLREKALAQLRNIVDQARADLNIPESAMLDTSPEGTADRIANFALGFFSKYAENNGLADDEAGRQKYADFIGKAINKGIGEARDILTGLQVLSPEVGNTIDQTADIIGQRLADFVKSGLN